MAKPHLLCRTETNEFLKMLKRDAVSVWKSLLPLLMVGGRRVRIARAIKSQKTNSSRQMPDGEKETGERCVRRTAAVAECCVNLCHAVENECTRNARRDCHCFVFPSFLVFRYWKICVNALGAATQIQYNGFHATRTACFLRRCRLHHRFKSFSVDTKTVNRRLSFFLCAPVACVSLSFSLNTQNDKYSIAVAVAVAVVVVVWVVPYLSVVFIFGWRRFICWHRHSPKCCICQHNRTENAPHRSLFLTYLLSFYWLHLCPGRLSRTAPMCQLNGQINHKSPSREPVLAWKRDCICVQRTPNIFGERQPHLPHELLALTFKC